MGRESKTKLKAWCRENGIDLCILFGSQVSGKTHARSDIDIALFAFNKPALQKQWLTLNGQLQDIFGVEIDLVIVNSDTDPVLRLEIFQHGKPLYESQPGLFVEQHIAAIKVYDDTTPLRRLRDRVLARRILNLKYVDSSKYVATGNQEQD